MALPTFDWFADRLVVARWESEAPGKRSGFFNCPVHGGSDSLHVTERNGAALVKCFGQDCKPAQVIAALEQASGDSEAAPEPLSAIRIRKVRRSSAAPDDPAPAALPEATEDAMDWYARYCGIDRAWIETMGVRASPDEKFVCHSWPTISAVKMRSVAVDSKGKPVRKWSEVGASAPLLWPNIIDFPLTDEVWLVEGETDAIVMRLGYGLPAYTAGSATTLPDEDDLAILRGMGVDSVVIAYDSDKEGRKARKELVASARAAGLSVFVAEPSHPIKGGVKDWRARWLANPDPKDVPEKGAAGTELEVWSLADVEPSEDLDLLLDRLDPEDHTILFGAGGTGKGVIAAWWAAELTRKPYDYNILVLDYESHARTEWRKRIDAFGGKAALDKVLIIQPSRAIWEVAGSVCEIIREHAIDYVIVDSALYACSGAGMDAYKPDGAVQYSLAIAQFKRPVLTLAHRTKSKEDNGQYPFGSTFWHNGARMTISVEGEGYDEPRLVKTVKANHGADFRIEIDWSWVGTGLPQSLTETDVKEDFSTIVLAELPADGSVITTAAIIRSLENQGVKIPTNGVPKALQKLRDSGAAQAGQKRGEWGLAGAVKMVSRKPSGQTDP